ncbi:hypothetical protein FQN60_005434 [Etheostoma spectabile]|uniref:G-protein coupled receptors family 1 profile domain-containing protein n=1 Tax=Etheostoma spectabile TaxID=54343 RepID=A0A5J5CHE5_9PERO|nr:hypothetical protein FQN60_005434 [Etheostoma spectabile]
MFCDAMFILLRSAVPCYVLLCLVRPTVPCYAMNYCKELPQTTIFFSIFVISTLHSNPNRPVRHRLPRAWVCPRFLPKRKFFLATVALLLALEETTRTDGSYSICKVS